MSQSTPIARVPDHTDVCDHIIMILLACGFGGFLLATIAAHAWWSLFVGGTGIVLVLVSAVIYIGRALYQWKVDLLSHSQTVGIDVPRADETIR